ncbi:DUF2752 domain-containing protein [Streptomyces sp. LHD-70]|uniref:DUF2752 domain-containing protein n=1 Tax=Streptomyces sp. LHD-70 TaxID=3072140 RepID=UPI0035BE22B4
MTAEHTAAPHPPRQPAPHPPRQSAPHPPRQPAPGGPNGPYAMAPAPDMRPRAVAKRLLMPVAVLGSVAAAFAYVGSVDPNEPGHYPTCPLLALTGILCPGCGGLRSAHAFITGDFLTALGANAAAVVGFVVFAVGWVAWTVASARGRAWRLSPSSAQLWTIGAVLAVFSVVRNLPFGAWLAP